MFLACTEQPIESKEKENTTLGIAKNRCELVPDPGPCFAFFKKYYYDPIDRQCKEFIWGGCEGVVPFDTMEECIKCKSS